LEVLIGRALSFPLDSCCVLTELALWIKIPVGNHTEDCRIQLAASVRQAAGYGMCQKHVGLFMKGLDTMGYR
jgi:hypothetical protein